MGRSRVVVGLCVVLCACSNNDGTNDGGVDASGGDATVDGSKDATGSDGSGSDGSANDAGTDGTTSDASLSGVGMLTLGSTDLGYSVSAAFFVTMPAPCPQTTMGACVLRQACIPSGTTTYASAGTVTISGGTITTQVLTPKTDNSYNGGGSTPQGFDGGETFEFKAAGNPNGVPAFDVTIKAPEFPSVVSPSLATSDGGVAHLTIDRAQPLTVTWNASPDGNFLIMLQGTSTSDPMITCTYPASAGTATIQPSVLGSLTAGQNGQLIVQGDAQQTFDAGAFPTTVEVIAEDSSFGKHLRAVVTWQ